MKQVSFQSDELDSIDLTSVNISYILFKVSYKLLSLIKYFSLIFFNSLYIKSS